MTAKLFFLFTAIAVQMIIDSYLVRGYGGTFSPRAALVDLFSNMMEFETYFILLHIWIKFGYFLGMKSIILAKSLLSFVFPPKLDLLLLLKPEEDLL